MRILHIIDVKNPKGNGVAVAVENYVIHENAFAKVAMFNLGTNITTKQKIKIYEYKSFKSVSELPDGFSNPDIVVFNEVYKRKYLTLYKECIKCNIPYVIIPHGCLTNKSLSEKFLKKKIANVLFFNKFVRKASGIQFLNYKEKADTKAKYKRVIISGNGIDIKKIKRPTTPKTKNFIYIGRYDKATKGLDLIIDTCKNSASWFRGNNIHISLYGRDSVNTKAEISAEVQSEKIADIISVNGEIYNKNKENIMRNAYAFIQVSRHEGQPMGIMEALSLGVPCIVTYDTSFGEYINRNKCGIGITFDKIALLKAIKQISEDKNQRDKLSINTSIVEKDFDWNRIAENCIEEYSRLLYDL